MTYEMLSKVLSAAKSQLLMVSCISISFSSSTMFAQRLFLTKAPIFEKETGQKHNPIHECYAFVVLIFFATASYGQIQLPQAVAQKLHSVERLCNAVVKLFPICQLP